MTKYFRKRQNLILLKPSSPFQNLSQYDVWQNDGKKICKHRITLATNWQRCLWGLQYNSLSRQPDTVHLFSLFYSPFIFKQDTIWCKRFRETENSSCSGDIYWMWYPVKLYDTSSNVSTMCYFQLVFYIVSFIHFSLKWPILDFEVYAKKYAKLLPNHSRECLLLSLEFVKKQRI